MASPSPSRNSERSGISEHSRPSESASDEDMQIDTPGMVREAITDGKSDIAMTSGHEKMRVDAPGRVPFQTVYLWTLSKDDKGKAKATNKGYDVATDGPKHGGTERLPGQDELTPHDKAKPYLEVGIVIGSQPNKYVSTGAARDKKRDVARQQRGILERHPTAMRVFMPITEGVAAQAKPYIGCGPKHGRLNPRSIPNEDVFFYAEFHSGVTDKMTLRARLAQLNKNCKSFAATDKSKTERATASITLDELAKRAALTPLVVTSLEDIANMLYLQYDTYKETGYGEYIEAMIKKVESAMPDVRYGPHTSDQGMIAFFDFDNALSKAEALMVVQELKRAYPSLVELTPAVVTAVHRTLIETELGAEVPYEGLAFFLQSCYKHPHGGQGTQLEVSDLKYIIDMAKLHNQQQQLPTTSKDAEGVRADARLIVAAIKSSLEKTVNFIQDSGEALAKQHGGIMKHGGIKELIGKIGNAIDVGTLQSLCEQISALQAAQYTSQHIEVQKHLEELCGEIDRWLALRIED